MPTHAYSHTHTQTDKPTQIHTHTHTHIHTHRHTPARVPIEYTHAVLTHADRHKLQMCRCDACMDVKYPDIWL